jgi:hypothetical protein
MTEAAPFLNATGRPSARPLIKLSSCVDFFDRDYDTLIIDVENQQLRFAWDIAAPGATRREVRVWRGSAMAFCQNQPVPKISEEEVYKLILPNRDIRSTELEKIFSCGHNHIAVLSPSFEVVREKTQATGPKSFTLFSRPSILEFLRKRRMS